MKRSTRNSLDIKTLRFLLAPPSAELFDPQASAYRDLELSRETFEHAVDANGKVELEDWILEIIPIISIIFYMVIICVTINKKSSSYLDCLEEPARQHQ